MFPLFKVRMEESAIKEATKVLSSGYIGQGEKVEEFEEKLKEHFKNPYVVTVNSGTSAEHLALHMLKEKCEGCDVLVSPLTCTATNFPLVLNGYNIKWVDVGKDLCIDYVDLERKLSPKTKIIYIMHWGGYPINYTKIAEIRRKCAWKFGFEPVILEDCAHAFGSTFARTHVGTWFPNSYASFSFQAIKHVTSVDGGCLICPDEESYNRAKLLRWYGIDRDAPRREFRCEEDIIECDFKFNMNDVCAAIGIENLKNFKKILQKQKDCAKFYDKHITNKRIKKIAYNDESAYWLYTMFVDNLSEFTNYMKSFDIAVSRVHERNDKYTCMKKYKACLPGVDYACEHMVCIPCGWWVTPLKQEEIVSIINNF